MKISVIRSLTVLFVIILFVIVGCSKEVNTSKINEENSSDIKAETESILEETSTDTSDFDPGNGLEPIEAEAFVGYWRMLERDENGEVEDVSEYPIYFLEVTENRLYIITTSLNENEGYSSADKYYVLDGAYCYYDYDEINQDNYKNALESPWGGRYVVMFDDEDHLVLTEYYTNVTPNDAYNKYTYLKIPANEWPISE